MSLHVFDSSDQPGRSRAREVGAQLLNRLLPAIQADDRFGDEADRVVVLSSDEGTHGPIAVGAVTPARRRDGSSLPPWSMQMVLSPENRSHLGPLVSSVLPTDGVELWVRPEHDALVDEIQRCWPGAYNCRRLHMMVVGLPVDIDPLPTRALDPTSAADLEAVVRVNNAAFASHPDQAGMSVDTVQAKLAGMGHSAQGVRLAVIDGEVNGFCWTQVHHRRNLGEISVIGLHPSVHGRGLGAPMTAAGLAWMHRQGLTQAILYVEADNTAAVRAYERLGFTTRHDDVSWMIPGPAAGTP